ncbi:MAG: sugar phosphate isomerase/epimerase [Lachnospiraceae bacterium]|nr:sugar phosphate isomerase/epimerase [Lachnospiraceae bacterium]
MKLCYNEGCAKGCSTLAEDIELCEKYGFDYIEIDIDMLNEYLEEHTIAELSEWFKAHRLKPYGLAAVHIYQELFGAKDTAGKNTAFCERFEHALKNAEALNAKNIIIVPPMSDSDLYIGFKDEIIDDCANALINIADMAAEYDVKLAFEPVGLKNCAVRSIAVAKDILYIAYKDNLGLAPDAYNLYLNGGSNDFSDVAALSANEIFAVHIMNADDVPAAERGQDKRTFPDRGSAVDVAGFLNALKAVGYDGMVSVEMFRPEYYEKDNEWVISEAYNSLKSVLEENNCL